MAATGFTPISLYYTTTAAATPSAGNLVAGELALNINTADEKLYFKNSAGTVKLLASSASTTNVSTFSAGTTGFTPSSSTSGAVTLAGTLAVANGGTGVALSTGTVSVVLSTTPTITTPVLTNPTITAYLETAPALANSGASQSIILSGGTVLSYTLTANCTFAMPATTDGTSFIVKLIQDATGGRTAVFTGVKYPNGTVPTITATATTGTDIISFVCINSIWYGNIAQAFA